MKPTLFILVGYGLALFIVSTLTSNQVGPLLIALLAIVVLGLAWLAGRMFFKAGRISFWATLIAVLLLGLAIAFTDPSVMFAGLTGWVIGLFITVPIALINILAALCCLWLRRRSVPISATEDFDFPSEN